MPGVIPYKEIAAWISEFDVGLVPHLNSELTKNMNPLKVFVYLSNGVPVVSSDVPNVDSSAYGVYLSKNDEDFMMNLRECLFSLKFNSEIMKKYAEDNSWKNRFHNSVDNFFLSL
jgi:CRISPR/Cas system endoribonuclease Cas6 (RAMP superfamily)